MNKKTLLGVIVVVIAVLGLRVYSISRQNDDVIKIGYFGPFTGLLGPSTGESVGDGFKLAESERSITKDKKIQVVYEDDSCDPKKAVSAAQKLIETDGVNVLVSGVCSSSTLAVAPIAEKNRIILITPTSASPKITTAGDYIFRLSSPTTGMAQAAVDYINKKGYTKVAILFENNEYPVGWKDSFLSSSKRLVSVEGAAPGSSDVKSQLIKLSQSKPEVYVFAMISPALANITLKQFKELGLVAPIVANDTFSLKAVHRAPDADGMAVVTYNYDLSSLKMKNFLEKYQEKYGREAKEEIYAALAYDTYNALFSAIEVCRGSDTECIKNELYNLKNVEGVSGTYSIDENGDTKREFVVRIVKDGQLVRAE